MYDEGAGVCKGTLSAPCRRPAVLRRKMRWLREDKYWNNVHLNAIAKKARSLRRKEAEEDALFQEFSQIVEKEAQECKDMSGLSAWRRHPIVGESM